MTSVEKKPIKPITKKVSRAAILDAIDVERAEKGLPFLKPEERKAAVEEVLAESKALNPPSLTVEPAPPVESKEPPTPSPPPPLPPAEKPAPPPIPVPDDIAVLKACVETQRIEIRALSDRLKSALEIPRNELLVSTIPVVETAGPCPKCERVYNAAKQMEDELIDSTVSDAIIDAIDNELGCDSEDELSLDDKILALFEALDSERKRVKLYKQKVANLAGENKELREELELLAS
jgi:hypothetical protein